MSNSHKRESAQTAARRSTSKRRAGRSRGPQTSPPTPVPSPLRLSVGYDFLPKRTTTRASVVMDYFGVGFEQGRHVIAEDLELPLQPGDIVFFTGASGSGKSSLLRAAAERLDGVCDMSAIDLGSEILADAMPGELREMLGLLAACGLGEAHLMLRTPDELSDGQRYRFRLARALADSPSWVMADEFTATLDRTLAKVIAYNVRRLANQRGTGFLLAATHEDIIDDLNPDVLVRCHLDGRIEVERRDVKKKRSASPTVYGSAKVPDPTGRTSLGGITAATTSGTSAG